MLESNYFIEGTEVKANNIELWSKIRLPFEPKGWLLDMKNSLRSALKGMQNAENRMLHAIYASKEEGYFDVENVLLYNVGTGSFSDLCRRGVCFERVFSSPIQPKSGNDRFPHYHRYSLIELMEGPIYWTKEHSLVSWKDVSCPTLRGEIKPHSFWYAIKNGAVEVCGKLEVPRYIGLELKISAPKGTRINLAAAIKPLLDGIISGFHSHDGSYNSSVIGRVAQSLGEEESDIEEMLMDKSINVLGKRKLLHPFGKGIQWNPADGLCIVAKVYIDDKILGSNWSLDGEIFTVVPCRN